MEKADALDTGSGGGGAARGRPPRSKPSPSLEAEWRSGRCGYKREGVEEAAGGVLVRWF
jgi:hypothetical protein